MNVRPLALTALLLAACGADRASVPPPAGGPRDASAAADASSTADAGATADAGGANTALCNDYCLESSFHCDGANAYFASLDECAAYCATLALGAPGDTTGDTLHCRLHWVDQPSATDPATNCPKASPGGGGVCD